MATLIITSQLVKSDTMEVFVVPNNENTVKKVLFPKKQQGDDGLIVKINEKIDVKYSHQCNQPVKRFFHCCFNCTGNLLACINNNGVIFIVDVLLNTYWSLPGTESVTVPKFSNTNNNEIFLGTECGCILIVDIYSGFLVGKLKRHKLPVKYISFSSTGLCVTTADSEGIIWNLKTNTKQQILNLNVDLKLKFLTFIPVTNCILSCLENDTFQLWDTHTWKLKHRMDTSQWNNHTVKNITFSENGSKIIIACVFNSLAVVDANEFKTLQVLQLPEYILTVKQIEIVPLNLVWKYSKMLAILSGSGVLYFYDLELQKVVNQLSQESDIIKFHISPVNNFLALILTSGAVCVYNLLLFTSVPKVVESPVKKKQVNLKKVKVNMVIIKKEKEDVLNVAKLKPILKEYGEFPKMYRAVIWDSLLQLPNNSEEYKNISSHITLESFPDLKKQYPLESEQSIRSLRILLNNLVSWSPFFANVSFLPLFVFPFVKVFQNNPIQIFEAVITIILNWCQHWFEYYPLPPLNIFSMVENLLQDSDPELYYHITAYEIKPTSYIWPLLETAFSEVLTANEWLMLWDHVLINEPSFLLCAVASYCVVHRSNLLSMRKDDEFNTFFQRQNPNNTKKFISKAYHILERTPDALHPRQYLDDFICIQLDGYPAFIDYPKTMVEFEKSQMSALNAELSQIKQEQSTLLNEDTTYWFDVGNDEKHQIEYERKKEMERAFIDKILQEQELVREQQRKLDNLRQSILTKEKDACRRKDSSTYEPQSRQDKKMTSSDEELLCQYANILKHKYTITEMFEPQPRSTVQKNVLQKQQEDLSEVIDLFNKNMCSKSSLKKLNITEGLLTTDNLIRRIKEELRNNLTEQGGYNDAAANQRLLELQAEARELEKDVSKLVKVLRKGQTNEGYSSKRANRKKSKRGLPKLDVTKIINDNK